MCGLRDQLMQMSTTHSSFDQYCISHKTVSHRAAPGTKVRRECPMTQFPALPLLATNPGDAIEPQLLLLLRQCSDTLDVMTMRQLIITVVYDGTKT